MRPIRRGDRYIFRTSFGAIVLILVSLTAVIWITQALRDIDLITGQGQTFLVFVGLTGLIIPLLVLVIAPIALVIAIAEPFGTVLTGDREDLRALANHSSGVTVEAI